MSAGDTEEELVLPLLEKDRQPEPAVAVGVAGAKLAVDVDEVVSARGEEPDLLGRRGHPERHVRAALEGGAIELTLVVRLDRRPRLGGPVRERDLVALLRRRPGSRHDPGLD